MKRLMRFWISWICYLVCIKCAIEARTVVNDEDSGRNSKVFGRSSNLQVQDYWMELDQNRNEGVIFEKLNEFGGDGRTVILPMDKCSRYCIEKGNNENGNNFGYINLFWTANDIEEIDQHLSKDQLQLLPKSRLSEYQSLNIIPKTCQIYLDLDCNVVEGEIASKYTSREFHPAAENSKTDENDFSRSAENLIKIPIRIMEKSNLSNQTQSKFLVNNQISRVVINVNGNVSSALLRIPYNTSVWRHATTISWSRKNNTDGVRIDTRNAPPGEWWLKLVGEDNSKYRFIAEGFNREKNRDDLFLPNKWINENVNEMKSKNYHSFIDRIDNQTMFNGNVKLINSDSIVREDQNTVPPISSLFIGNRKIVRERSLKYILRDGKQSNQKEDNVNDNDSSVMPSSTENEINKFVEYVSSTNDDVNVSATLNNSNGKSPDEMSSVEQQEKPELRSSIGTNENLDIYARMPLKDNVNVSMRRIEALDNQELSEELVNYPNENTIEEKKMLIELNRNSNLLVTPGTIHRVVFDVKNNCVLPVRYAFRVKSTPFRVYNVQPVYAWIYPGQMSNVAIDLVVPDNIATDTVNTVTLSILGTDIKEKSVYLYAQGSLSKLTDDTNPTIKYSFNNNCAGKLEKDQCYKSRWSMDIIIQDYDSGLKRVISSPNEIFPRTEFISGTRSPVTFYYSSSCCDKTAKVTAMDLLNNYNTYTIDVTAWNNLSQAEIAAISVGVLLAVLLVILIIILILYCIRRRQSLDLPYTQRYGSRPPAQSERTNL